MTRITLDRLDAGRWGQEPTQCPRPGAGHLDRGSAAPLRSAASFHPPGALAKVPSGRGRLGCSGFSLIEVVVVLVLVGILVAMVGLPVRTWLEGMRVRSALNRITAEIYRARSIAVADGSGADLSILSDAEGCVEGLVTIPHSSSTSARQVTLDLGRLCLRHSGGASLVFNSRGMVKPPTRSFHAAYGANADSVLVSIAGRVRRSYRTRRGGRFCRLRQYVPNGRHA